MADSLFDGSFLSGLKTAKDQCPTFQNGCPFSNGSQKIAQQCPAFKKGCPFDDVQNTREFLELMKQISESHSDSRSSIESFNALFSKVHHKAMEAENQQKEEVKKCPIFQQGCPFKLHCSNGKLLVELMEKLSKGIVGGVELASSLKEGTKSSHREAESKPFIRRFRRDLTRNQYARYLANLYIIYRTLEEEMEKNQHHPAIMGIHFPKELNRTQNLSVDLQYYYGELWHELVRDPCEATSEYCERIKEVSEKQPELLVAHAYTRYLGDLSGGQILKKMIMRNLRLPNDRGTAFCDFPAIQETFEAFKNKYRANLDALPITPEQADQIVTEANTAFGLNMKLFDDLEEELLQEKIEMRLAKQQEGLLRQILVPFLMLGMSAIGILILDRLSSV